MENISPDDLMHLKHVNERVSAALMIRDAFADYLAGKYRLTGKDSISSADGSIKRESPQNPAEG